MNKKKIRQTSIKSNNYNPNVRPIKFNVCYCKTRSVLCKQYPSVLCPQCAVCTIADPLSSPMARQLLFIALGTFIHQRAQQKSRPNLHSNSNDADSRNVDRRCKVRLIWRRLRKKGEFCTASQIFFKFFFTLCHTYLFWRWCESCFLLIIYYRGIICI